MSGLGKMVACPYQPCDGAGVSAVDTSQLRGGQVFNELVECSDCKRRMLIAWHVNVDHAIYRIENELAEIGNIDKGVKR